MSLALEPSREKKSAVEAVAGLLLGAKNERAPGIPAEHIIELLPAAVYVCDAAGRITFYNRRAVELWGREPALNDDGEKFCACYKVFLPDGGCVPPDATPMARAVREGIAFRGVEATVERPDGTRFEASVAIDPLRDAAGRLCGAINVFQDVTEQKQRERRAAMLDELTMRLAPMGSEADILRTATQFVGEHLRAQRCGFLEADAASDTLVVAEGWRPAGVPSLAGRYAAGQLLRPEAWHAIARGSLVVNDVATDPLTAAHMAAYPQLNVRAFLACPCQQARPRIFVLGVADDRARAWTPGDVAFVEQVVARVWPLVERARSAAALRQSEARLGLVTENGKLGIWDWDIAANRVTWTDSLYAIHGVRREEFDGTVESFAALVHPDDRGPVQRAIQSTLEHAVPYELEFRAVRPGGAVIWLFTTAIVVREDGRPVRMHGATFDITARKHAEVALRESEKRFRTLASHAPVGIFLTDPEGATVFVNESWVNMTGLTPEQARGEGWTRALHPGDRTRVAQGWREAVARGAPSSAEFRFQRADGGVTWVQGNAVQVRDQAGRVTGYIGTIADFTQRKLDEEKLREQEAQLRFIANNSPVSLAHCSRDGRFLFLNRANAERMGLKIEEAEGRTMEEVMGPEAVRAIRPYLDRVLAGEAVNFEREVPYRHVGKRFVSASYVPDRAPDGTVRGWLAVIADMTERREMENALRESEERFRQLADSMPQIVWTARADGEMDYFNRRWQEYAGSATGGTGHESFLACVHPDDHARRRELWAACVRSGEPFQIEYRLRRAADGAYRWYLGRALAQRDDAGRIVRWIGTCTEIHEFKLMRDELQQAQAQLQAHASQLEEKVAERTASLREAIAQMEEFSYSVSHDLRSPLRAMNAYAQALVEDYGGQLDDTARDHLARIQRASRRMEQLTHDVLTYSRLGRAEIALVRVPLLPLLRDVLQQYAELQPAVADVEIVEPLADVWAHETSLGQCLANLLTNAAKFVAPGVRPRIRVWTEPAGAAAAPAPRVRLWIADNGIGIDPRHHERLFRVFERVSPSKNYDGTGIGLAIVRRAAEKMGGGCGVESDGKNGSRFWIELAGG